MNNQDHNGKTSQLEQMKEHLPLYLKQKLQQQQNKSHKLSDLHLKLTRQVQQLQNQISHSQHLSNQYYTTQQFKKIKYTIQNKFSEYEKITLVELEQHKKYLDELHKLNEQINHLKSDKQHYQMEQQLIIQEQQQSNLAIYFNNQFIQFLQQKIMNIENQLRQSEHRMKQADIIQQSILKLISDLNQQFNQSQLNKDQKKMIQSLQLDELQLKINAMIQDKNNTLNQINKLVPQLKAINFKKVKEIKQLQNEIIDLENNQNLKTKLNSQISQLKKQVQDLQTNSQNKINNIVNQRQIQLNLMNYHDCMKYLISSQFIFDTFGQEMLKSNQYQLFKTQILNLKNELVNLRSPNFENINDQDVII